MALFLPVKNVGGTMGIGLCYRCSKKMYYGSLVKDPNNSLWLCKECVDIYDPWRLPARRAEDISLRHPRPDIPLSDVSTTDYALATENLVILIYPAGVGEETLIP
jgi:hypothetical protein